jgi:diguanylate cyclase (GGDEF)-like protein/PAS domain S-box-containing protein
LSAKGNYVGVEAKRDLIRPGRADVAPPSMRADTASMHESEVLLEAVTVCITQILNADSLRGALADALKTIASVVQIDRMVVIEKEAADTPGLAPTVFFVWNAADAPKVDAATIIASGSDHEAIEEWLSPLREGHAIVGIRRLVTGPMHDLMHRLHVVSMLQVPMMLNGVYSGVVVFDDCKGEHEWSRAQINILKLLAEFIGTAATRERAREELRYRDVLLAAVNASVVQIMTAADLHEAISVSLERVATAVRADRMLVLELEESASGVPYPRVRNSWSAAGVRSEFDRVLRTMSRAIPDDVLKWAMPLQRGQPVSMRRSLVSDAHRDFLERLNVHSALLVPIMANGKYWGHISFDDCTKERDWTDTEIGILTTLAQLIGTAITRERYVEELAKANTIVQNSPTILYRLRGDPSFPMIYISQNISLLGYSGKELLNSPTLYQSYVHPADRIKVQNTMVELLRGDAAPTTIEYRMFTKGGESRWMENRYTPVRDLRGRLVEIEGIMIDITERKLAEDRIALLAQTDVLTGLPNRATFNDRLRQAFAASRAGANPFAVLYLDLDRFKEVNDTRGHPVGDKLLEAVAQRLKRATRAVDFVARLGGDEFAILQADALDPSRGGALAANVIASLSLPYGIAGEQFHIGASVGISIYSADAAAPDDLLVKADQALYRAKDDGRGQFRFHSDELDLEVREYAALADGLRHALRRGELELYYQSQVELSSGRIVGMEALIRWNHPTRGLLLPSAFMAIAEKSSMIQDLGRWVLDGACRQLSEWRKARVAVPQIAVNVSLGQIKAGKDFVRDVKDTLARWALAPSDLELDVTEFALARTTLLQSDVLEELRRLGVCIAIDDFGAQYSSLDYLRTYRVNRLKIASHMVAAAADEGGGQAMIRAIVVLAAELGVEVVAEGVETEDQRAALVKISSKTKGQGFYFSQPMPAGDTTQKLRLLLAPPRAESA